MFSVYGKVGRVFRGSMEALRNIGPPSALAAVRDVRPVSDGSEEQRASQFAGLLHTPAPDLVHRSALAAYAQTIKDDTPRHPLSHVADIMSHAVVTIADTCTVEQAWAQLAQHRIGQAPVVGPDGVLMGLLARGDLMHPDRLPAPDSHPLVWRALMAQSVVDIMATPVPGVATDTDIRRVARVLLDTGLPGLPVVDDAGHVIGFVSRSDILRAVVADQPLDLWT